MTDYFGQRAFGELSMNEYKYVFLVILLIGFIIAFTYTLFKGENDD